jgi:hypothetical protein
MRMSRWHAKEDNANVCRPYEVRSVPFGETSLRSHDTPIMHINGWQPPSPEGHVFSTGQWPFLNECLEAGRERDYHVGMKNCFTNTL